MNDDVGDLHFNINSDVRILRQNVRTWTSSHQRIYAYQLCHKSDLSFPSFQTQTTSAVSNLTLEVQNAQEEKLWNAWLPSSGQPQFINIPKLCHVMSCLIRTVDVYNLGAWVLAVWGQTKWKRWVAGKRWRGNLDRHFPTLKDVHIILNENEWSLTPTI